MVYGPDSRTSTNRELVSPEATGLVHRLEKRNHEITYAWRPRRRSTPASRSASESVQSG